MAVDTCYFTQYGTFLTLSPPIPELCHTGLNQSARMSKIINGELDQYGPELFEQQQFATSGVEGVNQLRQIDF